MSEDHKKTRFKPLFAAAREGDCGKITEVLTNSTEPQALIDENDAEGWTPLFCSASTGKTQAIELLLNMGASIDKTDSHGQSALFVATFCGHIEAAKLLVERGANILLTDNEGTSLITIASRGGYSSLVELFASKGASVNNSPIGKDAGRIPLLEAAFNDQIEAIELLVGKLGANLETKDDLGRTALYLACSNNSKRAVETLLRLGSDINNKNDEGRTPLSIALEKGFMEIVNILKEAGGVIDDPLMNLVVTQLKSQEMETKPAANEPNAAQISQQEEQRKKKEKGKSPRCENRLLNSLFWALTTTIICIFATFTSRFDEIIHQSKNFNVILDLVSQLLFLFAITLPLIVLIVYSKAKKNISFVNVVSLLFVIISTLGFFVSFVLSFVHFGKAWTVSTCEEREVEHWNVFAMCCLRGSISLVLCGTSLTVIKPLYSKNEKELSEKPISHIRHKISRFLSIAITLCFAPKCCRDALKTAKPSEAHTVHHIIQLVYEIILLVVAIIGAEYINILAIGAGLLASFLSVISFAFFSRQSKFHFIRADLLLNSFALSVTLFTFPMEIAHIGCAENKTVEIALYIVLFAIGADLIRLNSVLHSTVEHQLERYRWLEFLATGTKVVFDDEQEEEREFKEAESERKTLLANKQSHNRKFLLTGKPKAFFWITFILFIISIVSVILIAVVWLAPSIRESNSAERIYFCEISQVISNQSCQIYQKNDGYKYKIILSATVDTTTPQEHNVSNIANTPCVMDEFIPGYWTSCWYGKVYQKLYYLKPEMSSSAIAWLCVSGTFFVVMLLFFPLAANCLYQSKKLRRNYGYIQ